MNTIDTRFDYTERSTTDLKKTQKKKRKIYLTKVTRISDEAYQIKPLPQTDVWRGKLAYQFQSSLKDTRRLFTIAPINRDLHVARLTGSSQKIPWATAPGMQQAIRPVQFARRELVT